MIECFHGLPMAPLTCTSAIIVEFGHNSLASHDYWHGGGGGS